MRNIYLSFLGLGTFNRETNSYYYHPCKYEFGGTLSSETRYVQKAGIEILGNNSFDMILIAATETSYKHHFEKLKCELEASGCTNIYYIPVSEDLSGEAQWKNVEMIISFFERGDNLTVDMTHGFRSIPIYFSAAINFLQKSKNIKLQHVFYGAFDKKGAENIAPIIDMKEFYIINEWADAVNRLIEDADACKLADIAAENNSFTIKALNNEKLINDLRTLSLKIKGVDIHDIATNANKIFTYIHDVKNDLSEIEKILMELIEDKFIALTSDSPGKLYDRTYYDLQISIIGLLLEHELYMQGFTVMREYIASIGMNGLDTQKKKRNRKYAEVFLAMLRYPEDKWLFSGEDNEMKDQMIHIHEIIKNKDLKNRFTCFIEDMIRLRNGFDHAWTSGMKHKLPDNIKEKSTYFYREIREITEILRTEDIL